MYSWIWITAMQSQLRSPNFPALAWWICWVTWWFDTPKPLSYLYLLSSSCHLLHKLLLNGIQSQLVSSQSMAWEIKLFTALSHISQLILGAADRQGGSKLSRGNVLDLKRSKEHISLIHNMIGWSLGRVIFQRLLKKNGLWSFFHYLESWDLPKKISARFKQFERLLKHFCAY